MRFLKVVLALLVLGSVAILGLRLAHPLPPLPTEPPSVAIPASPDTALGRALLPRAAENPGLSGIVPLPDGRDALAARVLMSRAAEETIDVQYYIWQTDTTGWLLLEELRAAAERGVRVRLLLDDNGIPGLDSVLAAMDALATVEVRIFNPFTMRRPKLLSYAFDFPRLNRRMHNKSMTVDGIATVIGGRNIGDIYFAYGDGTAYFDLDVLAVGTAAEDVSVDFDRYWASASAYPAQVVLPPSHTGLAELAAAATCARGSVRGSDYLAAIGESPLLRRALAGEAALEWTTVTLVSDDPAKGLGQAEKTDLLVGQMPGLLESPERSVDLVSAYLIPGRVGTDLLQGYARDGLAVRVVTNSLEATDVPPVHSAWMRYRDELIAAGVTVLELRARPEPSASDTLTNILMGSVSSLHAKTFTVDGERVFIGSFNFDPRSASLNTEMGFLIDSPGIAKALARTLDGREAVYEVVQTGDGLLAWIETQSSGETATHTTEPNTSALERAMVRVLSWLPIEWIL